MGSIVCVGATRFLYYTGWNLAVTVPWKNTVGLAISKDGGPFERSSAFPVVALDERDPFSLSYPWVMQDGDKYRMWYGSNLGWEQNLDDIPHVIRYAESSDGIRWDKQQTVAEIDASGFGSSAACRPTVVREPDGYRMWFCARGGKYRIYSAISPDGLTWQQLGKDGIDVSPGSWDSDMVEYPCVFDHGEQRFLLYSADGYGRTGFGLAVLEN